MKGCSVWLVTRKYKFKSQWGTTSYPLEKLKRKKESQVLVGMWSNWNSCMLMECEMVQPLWKITGLFLIKLITYLPCNPAILLLVYYQREMKTYPQKYHVSVHRSFIPNSPKLEITQMPSNRWIDKPWVNNELSIQWCEWTSETLCWVKEVRH